MKINEFLSNVKFNKRSDIQIKNLEEIKSISHKFYKDSSISTENIDNILHEKNDKNTVVLEAAHQPTFLPYSGIWKKVVYLNFFSDFFKKKGAKIVALFGFADLNIATLDWLNQNRIPSLDKKGIKKIGFKISGKNKWKTINNIPKPGEDTFEREIQELIGFYRRIYRMDDGISIDHRKKLDKNLDEFSEIFYKSYEIAENFSDMNAILFSKICNELWDLNVIFFRYSDVQKNKIFLNEYLSIVNNVNEFNKISNQVIKSKKLGMNLIDENLLPFWFHCDCGNLISLFGDDIGNYSRKCPVCNNEIKIQIQGLNDIKKHYSNLSTNVISRNIVYSHGLGDALYITGTGGFEYGKISEEISKRLQFTRPISIIVKGRGDYYLGIVHKYALFTFMKNYGLKMEDLNKDFINKIILTLNSLKNRMNSESDYKELNRLKGKHNQLYSSIISLVSIFDAVPSILDLIVILGIRKIVQNWKIAESDELIFDDYAHILNKNIYYNDYWKKYDNMELIYQNIDGLSKTLKNGRVNNERF